MEDLLRTIFEAIPEKTSIIFKGRCFDCDDAVRIEIFPTSQGFGLLGGALVESSRDKYAPKCKDCYEGNGTMLEKYKVIPDEFALMDKKDILSSILLKYK